MENMYSVFELQKHEGKKFRRTVNAVEIRVSSFKFIIAHYLQDGLEWYRKKKNTKRD